MGQEAWGQGKGRPGLLDYRTNLARRALGIVPRNGAVGHDHHDLTQLQVPSWVHSSVAPDLILVLGNSLAYEACHLDITDNCSGTTVAVTKLCLWLADAIVADDAAPQAVAGLHLDCIGCVLMHTSLGSAGGHAGVLVLPNP